MRAIKISILDDDQHKREKFRDMVCDVCMAEECDIGLIDHLEVKQAFETILTRRSHFWSEGSWITEGSTTFLDETDILIVDNDLYEFFRKTGIATSADEVAYMARCFSTCKLIVVVNRTDYNPFDLTGNFSYFGQFDAFSDIEVGQTQLASNALWGRGTEVFHPWYWFDLFKWLVEFEQRVQDAETALQENVCIMDFFQLRDVQEWLPRRILQTLGDGKEYTFGEFVRSSSLALSPKDRANLPKDFFPAETIYNLAPIVAARLWKWLEVQLLPELDILIDAPHLVTRFPSLLNGDHGDVETWNGVTVRHKQEIRNVKLDLLEASRFSKTHWLTRPAWYWRRAMNDEAIPDVRQPWEIEYVPFVFCEDTSRFALEEQAKSYRAAVDSPFGLRYIEKLEGVNYLPLQRLAM